MKLKKYQKENAKLRKQILQLKLDWESERDYANQMETNEKKAVAENNKLRRELNFYKSQVEGVEEERLRFRKRWKEAVAENAKLREVCTDAYKAICKMYVYIDGEWNYGDVGSDPVYGPILRRMRKLGIEVSK